MSTGEIIHIDAWNPEVQRVRKSYPGGSRLNFYLDTLERKVEEICKEKRDLTQDFKKIKGEIRSSIQEVKNKRWFFIVFDYFIHTHESKQAELTIKKYQVLYNILLDFQKSSGQRLNFSSLDTSFFDSLNQHLLEAFNHNNATIDKYISALKTFLKWSQDQGGLGVNDSYLNYKTNSHKSIRAYLGKDELERVKKLDLSQISRLDGVRDIFLFACFTGRSYKELLNFKRSDLQNEIWHISKGDYKIPIFLPRVALDIISKYEGEPSPLPMISIQKFNDYIKEVCELAELNNIIDKEETRGESKNTISKPKYKWISMQSALITFKKVVIQSGIKESDLNFFLARREGEGTLSNLEEERFLKVSYSLRQIWDMV